jgi:hypothetical protein
MRSFLKAGTVLMVIIASTVLIPPTAQASTSTPTKSTPFCTQELLPLPAKVNNKAITAPTALPAKCFSKQSQALSYGLKDAKLASYSDAQVTSYFAKLRAPKKTALNVVSPSATTPAGPEALGRGYTDANFGGSWFLYTGATSCAGGKHYYVGYVGANWNDKFSSIENFNNCNYYYSYVNLNQAGSFIDCSQLKTRDFGCRSLPYALNDEISSMDWHN